MAYFDEFPDVLLPSFSDGRNSASDFSRSKNLFKRAKIRDDFFSTATVFGYYSIIGDDRPDNVAQKLYGNSDLDWIVLISNNIIFFIFSIIRISHKLNSSLKNFF